MNKNECIRSRSALSVTINFFVFCNLFYWKRGFAQFIWTFLYFFFRLYVRRPDWFVWFTARQWSYSSKTSIDDVLLSKGSCFNILYYLSIFKGCSLCTYTTWYLRRVAFVFCHGVHVRSSTLQAWVTTIEVPYLIMDN